MDRTLEPGAVTTDVRWSLLEQHPSQDDFKINYSTERLKRPWFVALTWDRWDRMELEVGNLKEAIARRRKPSIPPSTIFQQDQEVSEKDEQDNQIEEESRISICKYSTCSNPPSFSSFPLFWTVPNFIGHQNVTCNILFVNRFLLSPTHDAKFLPLVSSKSMKICSRKVWDPGG